MGAGQARDWSGIRRPRGNYAVHPKWKFVFVNHVTTNPFFIPTQYGAADACALVGCGYQWTGSATADVGQMVSAFNARDRVRRPTGSRLR